jgi:ParB family chromosome partitioning protein
MKFLHSGQVVRLPLDAITIGDRLRQVSEAHVAALLLMAEDSGLTTPIHVRKVPKGHELIDGAHRVETARRRGDADIACLVVECRQDEARQMEAGNNLGAASMSPVQRAVFAASWKRDYYAAHPDRARGVFKGNQHTGKVVTELSSLTKSMAAVMGVSERWAAKMLAIGERLTPEEARTLDRADQPIGPKHLADLAKVADPEERARVVSILASGNAKAVAVARRQIKVENGEAGPVKTPKDDVEEGFKALSKLWGRIPQKARRQFVAAHRDALLDLIGDVDGGGADE